MAEEREAKTISVELAIQREIAYREKVASFLSEKEKQHLLPLQVPSLSKALKTLNLEMHGKKDVVPSSSTYASPYPRPTLFVGQSSTSLSIAGTRPCAISSLAVVAAAHEVPISNILKPSPVPIQGGQSSYPRPNLYPALTQTDIASKATTSSLNCFPNQHQHPYYDGNGPERFCHVCKVSCPGLVSYKQHLRGHKHRAKLQFMKLGTNIVGGEKKAQQPRCELCQILCTDETSLQLHYSGQKHKAKLHDMELGQKRKAPQMQWQWCGLCEVPCANEEAYEQHLRGKNHAARLYAVGVKRSK